MSVIAREAPVAPHTIHMHPDDNVAIVANDGGLPAGTRLPGGLVLRERVPQGHKVALSDIAAEAPVLRYGIPIGYAAESIPAGSWVHERRLRMPAARSLDVDTAFFYGDTVLLHASRRNAALAQEFARYIAAMRPLPGLRTAPAPGVIHIYMAENEAAFAQLTGGSAPHWGAGIAQPDSGIIVLPAYSSDRAGVQNLGPVIRHEIAHVALQRSLPGLRIPRWFTEGYAVWSAGQLDPDADWYLRIAFLSERAPPLDSLELGWPAGEVDARVAYLLSASAVSYLHSLGPDEVFAEFLDHWRQSGSFEQESRSWNALSSTRSKRTPI